MSPLPDVSHIEQVVLILGRDRKARILHRYISMFERYAPSSDHSVTIFVDERELQVEPGVSVAAALLAAGYASTRRTPVSGSPRGPWCLMGTCFDCLVAVDGVADTQACVTTVREGMHISLPGPASGGRSADEVDPWSAGP